MSRRGEKRPSLTVRVSHEPTRLSQAHVAAAFEQLVPALERHTRSACAEHGMPRAADAQCVGAMPTAEIIETSHVTTDWPTPRVGARRR